MLITTLRCFMTSQEVINILKKNGWVLVRITGSHHIFKHPT